MKRARIQLLVGDRVEVVLDPYLGKTTDRIVWRRLIGSFGDDK